MKKQTFKIEYQTVKRPQRDVARRYYVQYALLRKPTAAFVHAYKLAGKEAPYKTRDAVSDARYQWRVALESVTSVVISRTLYGKRFSAIVSGRPPGEALDDLRYEIKRFRRGLVNPDNFDSTLHRKISTRPMGYYLKAYRDRILKTTKVPRTNDTFVGIEVECILPNDADTTPLIPFGKWVNVGTDGSISCDDSDETGTEIRICVERENVRTVLPSIMAALKSMGAYVNKSCGLHVHLDQRNNPAPETAFKNLVRSLGLLYTVVPASRRDNTYCKRNHSTDFAEARDGARYKAINATAFDRYKTIEVRLFGGTLEATKIINWIETLFAIATGAPVLRCPRNFETARKYWALSDENIAWLKDRQTKFSTLNGLAPQSENQTENQTPEIFTDENADNETEGATAELADVAV